MTMSRVRRTIALAACAAVVLTGSLAGAAARTAPAKSATVADTVPDAYGLDQLDAAVKGSQVSFFQRRTCAAVLSTLQAGQWTISLFAKPQKGSQLYVGTMTYGERAAMLMMTGSGTSCSGTVTVDAEQPITSSGDLTASGTAKALTFYCHVGPDLNGTSMTDVVLTYIGMYRSASGAFIVMVNGPATVGTHKLVMDEDSGQGITVLPVKPGLDALKAMTGFFGGMYSGDGYGEDTSGLVGMYGGGGTLAVTSAQPFAATVTGTNLTDQDHKSKHLSFTAGMGCDS
jgi:hypothetical protein